MYTLKDKAAGSLSRLFADSASHHSSPSSPSSPRDLSQARWYTKGSKSLSSIFSYIIPSLSYGESKLDDHGGELKPVPSFPVRWKKKFETRHEVLDSVKEYTTCTTEELKKACEDKKKIWTHSDNKQIARIRLRSENKDCVSGSRSTSSDEFQEAREEQSPMKSPLKPDEFHEAREEQSPMKSPLKPSDEFQEAREEQSPMKAPPKLSDESVFINYDLYEFLTSSLPNIVKGCQWMLLYSTLKHGISLRTLIRKSAELPGPCLLITGDRQGAVFGAMLECPLKPTPKRKYQGTNQTFVFTTTYGEPRLFRPTGANRYYYICVNDLLALRGGGNFALSLDEDLLSGTSGACETFGNLCLAHNQDFEPKNIELWGFTHASKHFQN
ncbi:hypothetical protein E1A91_D02G059100v1 [Gossypium mustelinum]|uniref:TLDc domain-containing protein n=1 Tax=Gossypium mustelinum TaxID=34275 RepID=A0A5D2VSG7_GOSMU|nr:hypothetical protein E1A91_D02G059100v1 [Gossypium mustelinum]